MATFFTQRMIIDAQRRRRLSERLEAVQQRIVPPWTAKGVLPDDETQWESILESPARARGDAWIVGMDSTSYGFRAGDAVVFDGQGWVNNGAAYIWERDLALPSERFRDVPSSELVLSPNGGGGGGGSGGGDCLTVDAFGGIVVSRLVGGDMTTVDPSGNSITNTGGSTGGTAQFPVLDPPFASSPALPALATRNGFGFVDFVREDGTWVWMVTGGFNRIRKLYGGTADLRNRLAGDILSDCIVSTDKGLTWTVQSSAVFSAAPDPFEGVAHPLLVHYRDTAVPGSPDVVYMVGGICSYVGKPLTRIGANHVYRSTDLGVTWERRRPNDFNSTFVRNFGMAGLVGVSGSVSDGILWFAGGAITGGEGEPAEPTAENFDITSATPRVLRYSTKSSGGTSFTSTVEMAGTITWSSPFLSPTGFINPAYAFGYTRLPTLVAPNQLLLVGGLHSTGQGTTRSLTMLVNPDNQAPGSLLPPSNPFTYLTVSDQFDGIVQRYPTSRVQPQLAYDLSFNTVILVGGSRVSGANFNGTIFQADPALLVPDRLAWREQFGLTNEQGMSLAFGRVREGALACRGDGKVYLIAGSISTLEKHQREVNHDSFEVEDLQNDRILEFTLRPAKRMVTLGPNVATTDLDNNGLRATIILQPPRPLTLPRLLGRSKYTEYVPGDGPTILCSLLGGHVLDRQITPLSGGEGMAAMATMTNEAVLDMGMRMQLDLGYKPHMIFVHLAPEFVDASTFIWRRSESAPFSSLAAAHTAASRVWFEAHEWICMAREKVVDQHGRGLLLEVVGTASSSQVEIGYLVPRSQLATPPLTADHSARRLQELKSATTESFIRGEASLGKAIQDRLATYTSSSSSTAQALMRHLQVTPSPSHPVPASTTYTPGSDLTAAYGSSLGATPETWVKDDTIDAVRLAIPQASVLNAELSRSALNSVLVRALDEWVRV